MKLNKITKDLKQFEYTRKEWDIDSGLFWKFSQWRHQREKLPSIKVPPFD